MVPVCIRRKWGRVNSVNIFFVVLYLGLPGLSALGSSMMRAGAEKNGKPTGRGGTLPTLAEPAFFFLTLHGGSIGEVGEQELTNQPHTEKIIFCPGTMQPSVSFSVHRHFKKKIKIPANSLAFSEFISIIKSYMLFTKKLPKSRSCDGTFEEKSSGMLCENDNYLFFYFVKTNFFFTNQQIKD